METDKLTPDEVAELEGLPASMLAIELGGRNLALSNRWGNGEVVGAWRHQGKIRLAWPSAENPDQLFNEEIEQLTQQRPEQVG